MHDDHRIDTEDSTQSDPPVEPQIDSIGKDRIDRMAEQRRRLDAQRKLKVEDRRLEEQRLKTLKYKEKTRRRAERKKACTSFFSAMTPKRLAILAGSLAIILILGILTLPGLIKGEVKTEYLTTSQLQQVVNISKLSSAEYVYNGIAEIMDEDGNVKYRIYYESSVKAGIDMSSIDFEIDQESLTVTPIIPEIQIDEPSIDESSFSYMPDNPDLELQDIIRYCKDDAISEVENQGDIYKIAQENIESVIEGLTLPLLEDRGYRLEWSNPQVGEKDLAPNNGSAIEEEKNEI